MSYLRFIKIIGSSSSYKPYKGKIDVIKYCFSLITRNLHTSKIMKKYDIEASKDRIKHSRYVQIISPYHRGKNLLFPEGLFKSSIKAQFENIPVNIPIGYDEILRKIYGDYMQYPPIEAQQPHHNFDLYM